jgi:hypothetical protein
MGEDGEGQVFSSTPIFSSCSRLNSFNGASCRSASAERIAGREGYRLADKTHSALWRQIPSKIQTWIFILGLFIMCLWRGRVEGRWSGRIPNFYDPAGICKLFRQGRIEDFLFYLSRSS